MKIGDKAPDLLGINQNGEALRLSDFKGKKVILYFYPKDNTSGCTAEACSLKENYSQLTQLGYEVIGVSIDSDSSHRKFIDKYSLPFPLIADTEKELVQQFGVWAEKSMYGRSYMGTLRTTFLIDEQGHIEAILTPKEIQTKSHGEQIIEKIRSL